MEPGQHPQWVAAFPEESAFQPGLDTPAHRLGGQNGRCREGNGHPSVADRNDLA
jgi:hypothetical protein